MSFSCPWICDFLDRRSSTESLNIGYGSLIEDYQRDDMGLNPLMLSSISLTEEEVQDHRKRMDQRTGDG